MIRRSKRISFHRREGRAPSTHLASGAKSKVLALHAISKLLLDGLELRAGLSATGQLLGAGLPPLTRLDDGNEVAMAHEEVGLMAGNVYGDELVG